MVVKMRAVGFLMWPLCALKHPGLLFGVVVGASADAPAFPLFNIPPPIGNSGALLQ